MHASSGDTLSKSYECERWQKRAGRRSWKLVFQPPQLEPLITAENASGYLQLWFLGLHHGIGPPSGAGIIGAATATYVQAKPTSRNNILTARFMSYLLALRSPWERESECARIIMALNSCPFE